MMQNCKCFCVNFRKLIVEVDSFFEFVIYLQKVFMKLNSSLLEVFFVFLLCFFLVVADKSFARQDEVNLSLKNIPLKEDLLLKHREFSFAFVILCHVRNESDDKLWKRCYSSIREFYPEVPIIIIDDNSAIPISNDSLVKTTVIRSKYPGAGELLPYYYFLKHKWADKLIVLHDSMLLRRDFTKAELSTPIKFHWHFDLHCWDNDPLINSLLSYLNYAEELIDYNVNKKNLWNGCFGVTSIIDLNVLKAVERKYRLISNLKNIIKYREERCALERIFGIVMFKEQYLNRQNCSNFGNICVYPHYYTHIDDNVLEELKNNYPGAILKTWQGR